MVLELYGTKSLRNTEETTLSYVHTHSYVHFSFSLTRTEFLIQLVMTLVLCVTRLGCPVLPAAQDWLTQPGPSSE